MNKFFTEFKTFAIKSHAVDLAIGFVFGVAFRELIGSFVEDIFTPLFSPLTGRIDLAELSWEIIDDVTINYGLFLNNIIEFLIVIFAIFLVVKELNHLRHKRELFDETKTCVYCKSEIPVEASRCSHCTSQLEPTT